MTENLVRIQANGYHHVHLNLHLFRLIALIRKPTKFSVINEITLLNMHFYVICDIRILIPSMLNTLQKC